MSELKYVPKNEVKEYKKEMMDALSITSKSLGEEGYPRFNVAMVGSVRRNLVLRKGSSLYDVDLQININKKDLDAKHRVIILDELKKHLTDDWTFDQSTSVITARKHNEKSFDLALIKVSGSSRFISVLDKDANEYIWNEVKNSASHQKRLNKIKGLDWDDVRDEYKKLRGRQWDLSEENKKPSYALYVETINNVHNNKKK